MVPGTQLQVIPVIVTELLAFQAWGKGTVMAHDGHSCHIHFDRMFSAWGS